MVNPVMAPNDGSLTDGYTAILGHMTSGGLVAWRHRSVAAVYGDWGLLAEVKDERGCSYTEGVGSYLACIPG